MFGYDFSINGMTQPYTFRPRFQPMFTGDFEKNAPKNDFGVASLVKRFTMSVLIMSKHYLRNAITGLYFDGLRWASLEPVKSFDDVDVAFIRCVWENVVAVPLTPEQEANEEGWSLEWFR